MIFIWYCCLLFAILLLNLMENDIASINLSPNIRPCRCIVQPCLSVAFDFAGVLYSISSDRYSMLSFIYEDKLTFVIKHGQPRRQV